MDRERRKRLASLSFSEKIKILEKLRRRDQAIAASGLRKRRAPAPVSGIPQAGRPPFKNAQDQEKG
jgi:hypothetical protein